MKYIRTKDGIFDETEHRHTIRNGKVSIMGIFYEFKQADTIEELCDEFVYLMESGKHICKAKHTDVMYCFDEDKPLAYYGAIWTDKGLIYVAKLNEKGQLELL